MSAARRAILMGHFSTVGDMECLGIVRRWLDQAHIACDIAPYSERIRSGLPGAIDPGAAEARAYTHLIVVCGPCRPEIFRRNGIALERFKHCVRIGVNLTMIEPVTAWNPFDVLLERDSDRLSRPDLAFLEPTTALPVVGRCLVRRQEEYGARQRHELAHRLIHGLITSRNFATIDIDTRCVGDSDELRTPAAIFSIMGRLDFLLTTRLHGMVYALKAGRPVIAIDPIAGGDKVSAQARALGWPQVILAENASAGWMNQAADWCLSADADAAIRKTQERILPELEKVRAQFWAAITTRL